ncbi:hypothetical protein GGP63_003130 [Salinibacter ruber]|nr:hypothetical protein [Salinibacter ruber]
MRLPWGINCDFLIPCTLAPCTQLCGSSPVEAALWRQKPSLNIDPVLNIRIYPFLDHLQE